MDRTDKLALIKKYRLIPEILLCALFFSLIYFQSGFWFETNDDHIICDILSGLVSGKPEMHTVNASILVSAPMAILYSISTSISWWGLFLLLLSFGGVLLLLDAVIGKVQSYWGLFASIVLFFSIALTTWYMRARVQYTTIAMLLAFSGYAAVALYEKKTKYIIFFLCQIAAYATRPQSMEIMQPIGLCLLSGIVCLHKEDFKNKVKEVLVTLTLAVLVIAIGLVSYKVAYKGYQWERTADFHEYRAQMFDYSGITPYEQIDGLSDEDISKEEYDAFSELMIFDYDRILDTVIKAAETSKNNYQKPSTIETAKWVLTGSYSNNTNRWIIAVLFVAFAGLALYRRKLLCSVLFLLAYVIGKGVSWGYLYQSGRMPYRVMFPLYFAEELVLGIGIVLLITSKETEARKIGKSVKAAVVALFCVTIAFLGIRAGRNWSRILSLDNNSYPILSRMEMQIADYCEKESNNRYIVSSRFYANYKRRVMEASLSGGNYVYSGGWFSCIPSAREHMEEYLETGEVYYITPVNEAEADSDKALLYLKLYYRYEPTLEDAFMLDTGGEAFVYRVR